MFADSQDTNQENSYIEHNSSHFNEISDKDINSLQNFENENIQSVQTFLKFQKSPYSFYKFKYPQKSGNF